MRTTKTTLENAGTLKLTAGGKQLIVDAGRADVEVERVTPHDYRP